MSEYVILWHQGEHNFTHALITEAESEDAAMAHWRDTMSPKHMREVNDVRIIAAEHMKLRAP